MNRQTNAHIGTSPSKLFSSLGVDMYDCVFPTRTARFGNALVMKFPGSLNIRSKLYRKDFGALEEGCECSTCKTVTRAHVHKALIGKFTDNICWV